MIVRLTGDLVHDLTEVLNWYAARTGSDSDLAKHLVAEVVRLQGSDVQCAVDEATANPGRTMFVGEPGPELGQ